MGNVPGGQYREKILHTAAVATGNGESLNTRVWENGAYTVAAVQIEGISGDTITFEATVDGTNWVSILAEDVTTGTDATTATADGIYRITVLGITAIRARISTYSAGTINVVGVAVA